MPKDLAGPDLEAALQALLDGHDVLRMRLERDEGREWGLRIMPRGTVVLRHLPGEGGPDRAWKRDAS